MAKKESIKIEDEWLVLDKLSLPNGTTVSEVEKLVELKPISISLEVILPKGTDGAEFVYEKSPALIKFRAKLEERVAKALGEIVAEDEVKDAKPILDEINSYLTKATKSFRVSVRTAVASTLKNLKPDDLMTVGQIDFKELAFTLDYDDDSAAKGAKPDLVKAFKRPNKPQYCGFAWNGRECVIDVKQKKPFKAVELKELQQKLPDGFSQGAHKVAGEFKVISKTKVEVDFLEKEKKTPREYLIRETLKKQTGIAVHPTVGIIEATEPDAKENSKNAAAKPEATKTK